MFQLEKVDFVVGVDLLSDTASAAIVNSTTMYTNFIVTMIHILILFLTYDFVFLSFIKIFKNKYIYFVFLFFFCLWKSDSYNNKLKFYRLIRKTKRQDQELLSFYMCSPSAFCTQFIYGNNPVKGRERLKITARNCTKKKMK